MAGFRHFPLLFLALMTLGYVSAFSIRHRSERSANLNLADALAILQRQRRRVSADDFLRAQSDLRPASDRMLGDEPLTLQDVSEWLRDAAAEEDRTGSRNQVPERDAMMAEWLPVLDGDFKEFDRPSDLGYDMSREVYPSGPVQASPNELEAIFETDDEERDGESQPPLAKRQGPTLSKKTKEEMENVKGDRTVLKPSNKAAKAAKRDDSASEMRLFNSLTKEEVKVLMKAVGKLQQQLGDSEGDDDSSSPSEDVETDVGVDEDVFGSESPLQGESIVVSEPVSREELKSVFRETEGPITKETKMYMEKSPGDDEPRIVEEQVVSEKLPEVEQEVENELTEALTNELESELEAERESEAQATEVAVADVARAAVAAAEIENASREEAAETAALLNGEEDVEDDEEIREGEGIPNLNLNDAQKLAARYWLLNNDKFFKQPAKNIKRRTAKRASGMFLDNVRLDNDIGSPSRRSSSSSSLSSTSSMLGGGQFGKSKNADRPIDLSWLSPQLQAFVVKIISLQDQVDRLRVEARLEDLENDALTDALNEATLAQMEGSVTDLEWSSLQQAIQLESAIQDIKHIKPRIEEEEEEEVDESVDDSLPELFGDNEAVEDVDEMPVDDRIYNKRARQRSGVDDLRASDVTFNQPDQEYPIALYGDDENESQDEAMDRLLEESYFLKRPRGNTENNGNEVASLFMAEPGRCPAVQRYSTDCALADLYSLPVDFEARALCNLHEMCYKCGKSLGVEQSQCDLVYTTAASSLCKGKAKCETESRVFLRAMKLKTRYVAHAQPACKSKCTAEFLGMF